MHAPRLTLALVLAACALSACGEAKEEEKETEQETPVRKAVHDEGPDAIRPFTEEQLRATLHVGFEMIHDLRSLAMPPKEQWQYVRRRVVERTEEGVVIETTSLDYEFDPIEFRPGTIENPRRKASTWKELENEYAWKPGTVVVAETALETPAGTFDCTHYDLGDSGLSGWTQHMWFSPECPGLPLRVEIRGEHRVVNSKTVVRWKPVTAPDGR